MKNAETKNLVNHILKVNDETFLIFHDFVSIELISKKDLTCIISLKLEESINYIENFFSQNNIGIATYYKGVLMIKVTKENRLILTNISYGKGCVN